MATQVASLFGVLTLDDSDYKRGLQSSEQATQGFGRRLQAGFDTIGGSMQRVGGLMSTYVTTPIIGGLGVAVNQSQEFNRTMSNVHSVLGLTGTAAQEMSDAVLELGGNTVAGPMANSAAIYDIVSAGITDQALALEALAAANAVAEAGQADLGAVTSGLISTINAYGLTVADIPELQDIFTRTVQMGVLSMDEMAAAFPQVTGLAAQFGLEADITAANLAYLTTQGYSASQSATFLRGMITTLLNPTADLEESITALGYSSGQSLLETEGLAGAYELLAQQNGGLAGLITNQEALIGALLLTKDAAGDFTDTFIEGMDGSTAAAQAINNQTAGFDKLRSKLTALAITVGNELSPHMLAFAENTLTPLLDSVIAVANANPDLIQGFIGMALAAAAAGPVIGILGTVLKGLTVLFSPLGFALAAGSLLVAAYANNWLGFRDIIDNQVAPAVNGLSTTIDMLYVGAMAHLNYDAQEARTTLQGLGVDLGSLDEAFNLSRNPAEQFANVSLGVVVQMANGARSVLRALGVDLANMDAQYNALVASIQTAMAGFPSSDGDLIGSIGNDQEWFMDLLAEELALRGNSLPPVINPLGGARADGGPVSAGTPYMVGERGPELFMPASSGSIVPNHALGGNVSIYVTQLAGESGTDLAKRITWELRRMA